MYIYIHIYVQYSCIYTIYLPSGIERIHHLELDTDQQSAPDCMGTATKIHGTSGHPWSFQDIFKSFTSVMKYTKINR